MRASVAVLAVIASSVFALMASNASGQEAAPSASASASAEPVEPVESVPPPKPQPKAQSMDDLLERVRRGWNSERQENGERELRFEQQLDQQVRLLEEAKATRAYEERRSEELEIRFEENELALAQLEETRRERLGALGELFGVVRQVSGDTGGLVKSSMTSAQFPGREGFLEELGKSKSLPAK